MIKKILDKSVVTIDLFGTDWPHAQIVRDSGATIVVGKNNNLKDAVTNALECDDQMRIKRKMFIQNYLFKIDGQAPLRVADVIRENI